MEKKSISNILLFAYTVVLLLIAGALAYFAMYFLSSSMKINIVSESSLLKSVISNKSGTTGGDDINEYGDFSEVSGKLSKLVATSTEWTEIDTDATKKGFYCIETRDNGNRMVYNIDQNNICGNGHKLSDFDYIWVDSLKNDFYCVINISGEIVDLSNYYILVRDDTGNLASRLIINCYEAKAIKLCNTILMGTLLAPDANVEYDKTTIYGNVYAKATTGTKAFYRAIDYGNYELILTETGNEVSFVNYNVRPIVLGNLKTNYPDIYGSVSDEYIIREADMKYIKSLVLDGEMIENLYTDLDYMTELETLSIRNTKIKSVDISAMKNLKSLDVSESSVTEIKLGENSALEVLNASNTKLSSVDIGKLTKLTELNLSDTLIGATIKYTNFTNLKKLYLKNTGFVSFSEEEEQYLGTRLEELDISENSAITAFDGKCFVNLKKLNIASCAIKSFDLSACEILEELDISYNDMTKIDVSANKNLKTLSAYNKKYTQITVHSESVAVGKMKDTKVVIK